MKVGGGGGGGGEEEEKEKQEIGSKNIASDLRSRRFCSSQSNCNI